MTPSREPAEYRELRVYIDDLTEILRRDGRPATHDEEHEARRLSEAAEALYGREQRAYDAWRRNPSAGSGFSYILSSPDPPPYRWSRIELRLGLAQRAEASVEPLAQLEPTTRQLWELTAAEKRRLDRDVRGYIATRKPPKREIARELGISRQSVDDVERRMRSH